MGRVEQHRGELYRVGSRRTRLVYGGVKATEGQAQSIQGARRSRITRTVAGGMRVRSGKRGRADTRRDPSLIGRTENAARVWVKERLRRATRGVRRIIAGYRKRRGRHSFEYGLRMVRGTRGLRVRVMANDRITRYLGIEIQSLCMYVLAAYRRGSAYSTEAGLKYFVRGAMASARRLLGGARVYGALGTRSRREMERRRRAPLNDVAPTRRRGYGRIRRGLRFKMGSAPRHMWVPDVYEGAPRGSTAYFAIVPKRAVRVAWRRRLYIPRNTRERGGLTRRGARSSLAVGSRRGLHQRRLKRFLAYSSIAHVGYMRCGTRVGSREGVSAVLVYGRIYRVMSRAVWTRRRVLEYGNDGIHGGREVKYRTDRGGRGEVSLASARARVRVSFSMAGVPPLAGFVSKLRVFRALVEGGEYRVAVRAVRRSVIGCFNYLRRIKLVQFDRVGREGRELVMDRGASRVCSASLRFGRARMWYPGPRRRRAHRMARSLVG